MLLKNIRFCTLWVLVVLAGTVWSVADLRAGEPILLAQADTPIKPQLEISDGENEPAKLKILPADTKKSDAAKTWDIISGTSDPAVLDRFIEEYPGTIQAALAAQKKGELVRSTPDLEPRPIDRIGETDGGELLEPEKKSFPEKRLDPVDLALEIQTQLNRVGCLAGSPDGSWGKQTINAAQRFKQFSNVDVETGRPNADLLAWLRLQSARVCPAACGAGLQSVNGQCVAKSCPSGQRLSSKGQCYIPKVKKAKICPKGQRLSSKGRCYTPRVKKAKTCKSGQRLSSKGRCYTPRVKKAKSCPRGQRLSSRGVCFVPKKKIAGTKKPGTKSKRICKRCVDQYDNSLNICGRDNIRRAWSSGRCLN